MKEKIFKNSKLKKVISIILFVVAIFFLCSCILYKVNAADGTNTIVYELSASQFRSIISFFKCYCFLFNFMLRYYSYTERMMIYA